jgi:hypothetical protein
MRIQKKHPKTALLALSRTVKISDAKMKNEDQNLPSRQRRAGRAKQSARKKN